MPSRHNVNRALRECWQTRVVAKEKTRQRKKAEPEPTEESKLMGRRFGMARKELKPKLTQTALAERAGLDQSAVSRFEKGERGFELENLIPFFRAAAEAGINLNFVFTGKGEALTRKTLVLSLSEDDPGFHGVVALIKKHAE